MGSKPIGLSASRGAAILGLSKWTTQFSVWQTIMEARKPGFNKEKGYIYEPFEGNASTRWGNAFEDAIIELAEGKSGQKVIKREKFFSYKDFITCHIDGLYVDHDLVTQLTIDPALHEAKTTTEFLHRIKWGNPGTDRVPQEYGIQAQHQMLCTGAEEVIFSVLVFPKTPDEWEEMGYKLIYQDEEYYFENSNICIFPIDWANTLSQMGFFHQYTVKRNQTAIDLMIENYNEFWNKNILEEIPPEPQDYDDLKKMIPNPSGTIVIDDEIEDLYREYKDITQEVNVVNKKKTQLKAIIIDRARKMHKEIDDESADKFIFRNSKGEKCGSFGKTKKGTYLFR